METRAMTIGILRNAISESESWQRFIQHPGFDEIPRPDFSLGVVEELLDAEIASEISSRLVY